MRKVFSIAIALSLLCTPVANAHTRVVSSNPAAGSTIKTMPAAISLTANENLIVLNGKQVSKISVHNPNHSEMKLGKLTANKSTLTAPILQKTFKSGTYIISYRIISADGHPVNGAIKFKLA